MRKAKLILSDLHLGAGRVKEGNVLEDFRSDEALVRLLHELIAESETEGTEIELILAGDILEFWQVPALEDSSTFEPARAYPPRAYLSTTEEAAYRRVRLVVQGHPLVFQALADFLSPHAPRRTLTIIKGNHDVQLYWGRAQKAVRDTLGATGERAECLTFAQRAISREGIYVEHGSEYADPLNRHRNFEDPRHTLDRHRLQMVPGGRISIHVLNRLERDHSWVGNVKPFMAVLWYLLRFDLWLALRMLFLLLPHLPALLWLHRPFARSNREMARELQEMEQTYQGDAEDDAPQACRTIIDNPVGLLGLPSIDTIITEEGIIEDPLLARGLLEEHRLHARLVQMARQKVRTEQACVVVFGHTHAPCVELLHNGAMYINAGSWTWMLDLREEPAATWRSLVHQKKTFASERRLTCARIDYDEDGVPIGTLREYR